MRLVIVLSLFALCKIGFANILTFPNSCTQGNSIIIAAVGDILLHQPLQVKGVKYGFESLWREAIPYFKAVDIVYGNLEGPIAVSKDKPASGFPSFNYPPSLANALKVSGFNIVSTANNHALDQESFGIDKTIEILDRLDIAHVGTRLRDSNHPFFYILNYKNFKIAWIACTEHTNGIFDVYKQVLYCYKKNDKDWILNKIHELKNQVDAIIITPHWGEEYQSKPTKKQIEFSHELLNAGAIAIIGSHPHVLQPLEKYFTKDGRTTLIMYSMGNFVSYQGKPQTRSTIILLLGLKKTAKETILSGMRFVPMYMENRNRSNEIFLKRLDKNKKDALPYQIISDAIPIDNAIYSNQIVINTECFSPGSY